MSKYIVSAIVAFSSFFFISCSSSSVEKETSGVKCKFYNKYNPLSKCEK